MKLVWGREAGWLRQPASLRKNSLSAIVSRMKKDTHPTYYTDTKVTCSCGNSFVAGSTMKEISVEICSQCHPFYTGKEVTLDAAGRVERFKARMSKKAPTKAKKAEKKEVTEKEA